jgi:hypothetical protein
MLGSSGVQAIVHHDWTPGFWEGLSKVHSHQCDREQSFLQ